MRTSLIIPSYERADLLRKSPDRLRTLPTQPDEVIVVDDGSQDGTASICGRFHARHVYLDRRSDSNSAAARNVGLRAATGDVVIVSDPEVLFDTDVVGQLREVGGDVLSPGVGLKQDKPGTDVADVYRASEGWFFTNAFMREWAVEVGGWDESFPEPWGWEDIDLWERLAARGHRRRDVAGCSVTHLWHPTRNTVGAPLNEAHMRTKQRLRDEGAGGIVAHNLPSPVGHGH